MAKLTKEQKLERSIAKADKNNFKSSAQARRYKKNFLELYQIRKSKRK